MRLTLVLLQSLNTSHIKVKRAGKNCIKSSIYVSIHPMLKLNPCKIAINREPNLWLVWIAYTYERMWIGISLLKILATLVIITLHKNFSKDVLKIEQSKFIQILSLKSQCFDLVHRISVPGKNKLGIACLKLYI